jgi:hypothetical protein
MQKSWATIAWEDFAVSNHSALEMREVLPPQDGVNFCDSTHGHPHDKKKLAQVAIPSNQPWTFFCYELP